MRWVVVVGVLVALAGVASAEDVRLIVSGDDGSVADLAEGAATARLRALGHVVRKVPSGDPLARGFVECARLQSPGCKLTQADGTAFALVIELRATTVGGERRLDVTGWLLEGSGGARLSSDQAVCEACDSSKVTQTIVGLTERLVKEGRARMGTTRLFLRSTPTGAEVTLDDEVVGVTDTEYTTYPGAHRVTFRRDGFKDEVREIVAHPNARTEVAVALVDGKGSPVEAPARSPRSARTRGWVVAGAGLALAVTGGVLIAIDEDKGSGGTRQPNVRDTALLGTAFVAAGALAGGLGGYWIWVDGGRSGPSESAHALLGVGGRF